MVMVDELHGDAATEDLLAGGGDLQSFFDQLGLEVADVGSGEAAEEELEWLSNKDAFPTVDTMYLEPALMGRPTKVVRRRRRRGDEELDWLPCKDAFLEVEMAEPQPAVTKVVRRLGRAGVDVDWLPNKDALPAVRMVDPEPAVLKVVRPRRRKLRRRGDEEHDWLPNKDANLEVPEPVVTRMVRRLGRPEVELDWLPNKDTLPAVWMVDPEPAVPKVVRQRRRRLRRRADEEHDCLPNKDAYLEVETKMVLRRRRAGAVIAPTAAEPGQRRCSHCGTTKTPHWRAGPEGLRTLCNVCGRRFRSKPPVPEYRPLSSATFRRAPELHTSMPRRIVQMCRSSATLVDVAVRLASPTCHLSRSPRRTKGAVCRKSRKPFRTARDGDLQLQASSDQAGREASCGGGEEELEWPSNEDALPNKNEDEDGDWLPNKNAPALETLEPRPSVMVTRRRRRKAATTPELGQRRCWHCGTTETPQWREGPDGPRTLCNACGVRYRTGRLVPEYRPLSSPTFSPELHSNRHRDVVKMRSAGVVIHRPAADVA